MHTIVFIAPLPPPVTGQSLVSIKTILGLKSQFRFIPINFSKDTFAAGIGSLARLFKIVHILIKIKNRLHVADLIYLTVSQSISGNLKDLLILLMCDRSKVVLHLHGGGIGKLIYRKHRLLYLLNKMLINGVSKIIVLGFSLRCIYTDMIPEEKISIIENFVESVFFIERGALERKFGQTKLKIIFLSNMIKEKGYRELCNAVIELEPEYRERVDLTFIGRFTEKQEELYFVNLIKDLPIIRYVGVIEGPVRADYLKEAHVFCLPTYYPYEGQPISILESYASGCFVLTTNQGGIRDIFVDGVNGYEVRKRSGEDIREKLIMILDSGIESIKSTAEHNVDYAKKNFTEKKYLEKIGTLFSNELNLGS